MSKFLFIVNQYYPNFVGGAEISVQTLVEELVGRGIPAVVISLATAGSDSIDDVNGVRVYRVSTRNLYAPFVETRSAAAKLIWHARDIYNRRMAAEVGRILDIERPTWVSTHTLAGFSVAVWDEVARRGIGLGHVLHDYYLLCPRSTMFRAHRNCEAQCRVCGLLSARKKQVSSAVNLVIGISRHVLQRHLDLGYFPSARSAVIHNARKYESAGLPPVVREDHALRIGYIGRLHPSKGVETLLAAVARLPAGKWRLRIAGREVEAGYADQLRHRFDRPEIEFVGYQAPDVFYRSIDLLVVPSIWREPLGMVVVEGLGFGVPVVVARSGGLPEILGDAGPGWLFSPGDVSELAAVLQSLLHDPTRLQAQRIRAVQRRSQFVPRAQADEFLEHVNKTRLGFAVSHGF